MTDSTVSEPVRRVLARDDLIMMAIDADRAVGIVRQREALARRTESEKSLFSVALEHHLRAAADEHEDWAIRAQAWKYAGVIVRFGEMVGIPVEFPDGHSYTAADLHASSITQLYEKGAGEDPEAKPRDLTLHTFHLHRAARDLRLDGRHTDVPDLAQVKLTALNGTGAEAHMALLMYEVCAAMLQRGQAAQVEDVLKELNVFYAQKRRAEHSTRYRVELIRGLAWWELHGAGSSDEHAAEALAAAVSRVRRRDTTTENSIDGARTDHETIAAEDGIETLSVLLARAEFLAARSRTDADRAEAVELGKQALEIAEKARGRWRVIARSRAPLAVVFQRIYGDIALLAASLSGREAAVLGLRVALSAKQTGFAARIRSGRALITAEVQRIIDEIIHEEGGPRTGIEIGHTSDRNLKRLRFELKEAVSPMLADTVLPPPADLSKLIDVIGDRFAVDYLELTDSLAEPPNHFRSLIRPGGRISFERFTPSRYYAEFFAHARERQNLAMMLRLALAAAKADEDRDFEAEEATDADDQRIATAARFDWADLARELLPEELLADLASPGDDTVEVLISAHSWLSLVPWPALRIPTDGRRMVERALVTQTPAFTCLYHKKQPRVTGNALVRLVGRDEGGVDVSAERTSWNLTPGTDGVPLSSCMLASRDAPVKLGGSLSDALRGPASYGFAHIAAHGGGEGLTQRLRIPEEPLSFGHALTLSWPESVLMASCHVGRVINVTEAEPLNLVMGMLSGGARCVVAGITSVDDRGTGRAASEIVTAIREKSLSLDRALHQAQLAAKDRPEHEWALLGAYVQ